MENTQCEIDVSASDVTLLKQLKRDECTFLDWHLMMCASISSGQLPK